MKPDDWVTVKGEAGVVSSISPDGVAVTMRIPQTEWPFPRYVTVPRKNVKKHRAAKPEHERALL